MKDTASKILTLIIMLPILLFVGIPMVVAFNVALANGDGFIAYGLGFIMCIMVLGFVAS